MRLWEKGSIILTKYGQQARETNLEMMTEFDALDRIKGYMVENRLKAALEVEVPHMCSKSNEIEVFDVSQRINDEPQPFE